MAAFARDFEVICADGCKAAAFFNVDSADRIFSIDMNSKHVVDLIHNPVFHELYGTAGKKLFGLLKDEVDRALDKLPMRREDFGDRQKNGRMRVVTATVHDAGSDALIRELIFFNKTEGVNIGSQTDRRTGPLSFEITDRAVAADAFKHRDTRFYKSIAYPPGRFFFLKG